jgi:tRNA 2-selenouridine synthase
MAETLPEIDDYRRLFLDDVPLLDVRAPVEFEQGAFPHAENQPLINDAERHEIGTLYKDLGQDAAVDRGHELVRGNTKVQRVAAWQRFAEQHPDGVLYCFRGGMRSKISQQWLYEATGSPFPRVKGGYKALRRFLIEELQTSAAEIRPLVIGGRTGVGKTLLLKTLDHALDLEGLAWHRGSAFGRHATPQPCQIDFENRLSIALLKHRAAGNAPLVLEDESRNIGSRNIPPALFARLEKAPLLLLEADIETRIGYTRDEYVTEALAEYQALHGEEAGFDLWAEYLQDSLNRIRKRLGGERHTQLSSILADAIAEQRRNGDLSAHDAWLRSLLVDYYDPMYDYQLSNKLHRVVMRGDANALRDWIAEYQPEDY